jgi:subtilisin family serine protease
LLEAVNRLLFRQALAVHLGRPEWLVDAVSMSFGYYHELPADVAFDQLLLAPVIELGRLGVAVVAAAGNDATVRHMYPAGFAPHEDGLVRAERDVLPVISVGALNPGGDSEALFSNAGPWVLCQRKGVSMVSTLPVTFDGSLQPTARLYVAGLGWRESLDPDDFKSGFATWSGTSFAAPVLAAEIVQRLRDTAKLDEFDPAVMVGRTWEIIESLVDLERP